MKDVDFSCKGCEKRHLGCHSSCAKYKIFKAVYLHEKKKEKDYNRDTDRTWRYINSYARKRMNAALKGKI